MVDFCKVAAFEQNRTIHRENRQLQAAHVFEVMIHFIFQIKLRKKII